MIYVNVRAILIRERDEAEEVYVQRRKKAHEGVYPIELPGGQLEPYESLLDCLKREVKEETGLDVIEVIDPLKTVQTTSTHGFVVECMSPYAVYQTVEGPVDSMGVYFKCYVSGEALEVGDDSERVGWVTKEALERFIQEDAVSGIDKAGMQFYLNEG
ncbi:MAG TPA: NUDIX hydrolase [Bacillota bacterium]|nr:NUDIX hydrolase [Bacillota bacterium]